MSFSTLYDNWPVPHPNDFWTPKALSSPWPMLPLAFAEAAQICQVISHLLRVHHRAASLAPHREQQQPRPSEGRRKTRIHNRLRQGLVPAKKSTVMNNTGR